MSLDTDLAPAASGGGGGDDISTFAALATADTGGTLLLAGMQAGQKVLAPVAMFASRRTQDIGKSQSAVLDLAMALTVQAYNALTQASEDVDVQMLAAAMMGGPIFPTLPPYNMRFDRQQAYDGVVQANNNVVSSASAGFVSGKSTRIGQVMFLSYFGPFNTGGAPNTPFYIGAFTEMTVTLFKDAALTQPANTYGLAGSGVRLTWGTDNRTAWASVVAAAARGSNNPYSYGTMVILPPGQALVAPFVWPARVPLIQTGGRNNGLALFPGNYSNAAFDFGTSDHIMVVDVGFDGLGYFQSQSQTLVSYEPPTNATYVDTDTYSVFESIRATESSGTGIYTTGRGELHINNPLAKDNIGRGIDCNSQDTYIRTPVSGGNGLAGIRLAGGCIMMSGGKSFYNGSRAATLPDAANLATSQNAAFVSNLVMQEGYGPSYYGAGRASRLEECIFQDAWDIGAQKHLAGTTTGAPGLWSATDAPAIILDGAGTAGYNGFNIKITGAINSGVLNNDAKFVGANNTYITHAVKCINGGGAQCLGSLDLGYGLTTSGPVTWLAAFNADSSGYGTNNTLAVAGASHP